MKNEFKPNSNHIVDFCKTEKESLAMALVLHMRVRKLEMALEIAEEALKFIGEACPSPVGIAYRALEAVAKAKGEV